MWLADLASPYPVHGANVLIRGLACDSRAVKPGMLFAAIPGHAQNGRDYIGAAVAQGAVAVLVADAADVPDGVSAIIHPAPRHALALLAARFYPQQPPLLAAVTGTSGKTSVVQFLRQLWQGLGLRAASIGTLGIIGDGVEHYGSLTTPDSIQLHRALQMLAQENAITHVALEASSQGIEQCRLDGVRLKLAAFTNFSRDHLDYHGSMETYLAAKLRLFHELLPQSGTAVVNADIAEYSAVAAAVQQRRSTLLRFGAAVGAELRITGTVPIPGGVTLQLDVFGKRYATPLHLAGDFQAGNVLCAAALAIAGGADADAVMALLPTLQPVRGRLEYVGTYKGGKIYVDYAHKPDALEKVLHALRHNLAGRLTVVFGCGGNRDAGKRPIMGAIAARLADSVIITDDNPRFEAAATIRAAIMAGAKSVASRARILEIADRAAAIHAAVRQLGQGDVCVIAGKGHETGQISQGETQPFDDAAIARHFLQE